MTGARLGMVALALALAAALGACSSGPAPTATPPGEPTATPGGPSSPLPSPTAGPTADGRTRLTVWHTWQGETLRQVQAVAEGYTDLRPGVEIEWVEAPDLTSRLLAPLPPGEGPDLVVAANEWIGRFSGAGAILPLEADPDAAYIAPAAQAVRHGGQVWGLPLSVETLSLFYNRQLLGADEA
ncbi:MAG: extracellular solute-binding protein, partial [Chloroflexi bacterium]|nr:extracellular solute-binding protein [Chloroflexota bacterium]